jgi:hypothetical protein
MVSDEEALPTTHPIQFGGSNSEVHNAGEVWAEALWEAYVALDEEATASGVLLDSQPFASASTATAVSVRGGGVVRRAGPTWSTARQLTGYYLVECEDESEAEVWALKIPAVSTGEVEIRRIMDGPAG